MNTKAVEVLKGPAGWALVILVGAGVVYYIVEQLKQGLLGKSTPGSGGNGRTGGVAGAVGGTSDLQTSTNLDGSPRTAYQGKGLIGTLGAQTNNLTGGALSSLGEEIGGWFYDELNTSAQSNESIGGG